MFLQLLEEIQEKVLYYCLLDDVKNLSLLNWDYYKAIREYLYRRIVVPEHALILKNRNQLLSKLESIQDVTVGMRVHIPNNSASLCILPSVFKLHNLEELYLSGDIRWWKDSIHWSDHEESTDTYFPDDTEVSTDAAVALLCEELQSLKKLVLRRCTITCQGCLHLSKLNQLHTLGLPDCHLIDDKALEYVSHVTNLKSLDVSLTWHIGNDNITQMGLDYIATLSGLKELIAQMRFCNDIRLIEGFFELNLLDASLSENLEGLDILVMPKLSDLNLCGCSKLSDDAFIKVCQIWTLRKLNIDSCTRITDVGFQHIVDLENLEKLNASNCLFKRQGFERITQLIKLKMLSISGVRDVGDMDFWAIHKLTKLEYLDAANTSLGNSGLANISFLSKLKYLCLNQCQHAKYVGFASLSVLEGLQILIMSRCHGLTFDGFAALCRMTNLKELDISYSKIHCAGFEKISNLRNLESLIITKCDINDSGFYHVCMLKKLKTLDISQCGGISDQGFVGITNLVALECLYMTSCGISSSEVVLHAMQQLIRLKVLEMQWCHKVIKENVLDVTSKLKNLKTFLC